VIPMFIKSSQVLALLFCLTAIPITGFSQAYPSKELLATSTTVLNEVIRYPTTGPAKITASIITIEPGVETLLHRHPVPMFAYILDGELSVDYGDSGKRIYKKGEALMESMNTTHRGLNHGTKTVSLLVVYMGADGTNNVELKK